jgi:hypothetical protein
VGTLYLLTLILLFSRFVLAQTAQPASSNANTAIALRKYDDPVNGVRFQYPASWLFNQGRSAYIPPVALANNSDPSEPHKPEGYVVLQGRDAREGRYRNTNLINGWFFYRVEPGSNQQQCDRKADLANDPSAVEENEWKADWTMIGGVRFRHGSGRGEALCNQSTQDVYTTVQAGRCYIFEKQINTICEQHGDNGIRDITPNEMEEINQAFDEVLQSVRLRDSGK